LYALRSGIDDDDVLEKEYGGEDENNGNE
jgi:hypothetical protein